MLSFVSAIGPLTLVSSGNGIQHVRFCTAETCEPTTWEQQARAEIEEYLAGKREKFTVPLDRPEPKNFRQEVQWALASISFGEVKTYGQLAAELGRPGAARAVGTACARNPLPILVPCHRVLAKSGLGGYLGGLSAKGFLLDLERIDWHA
ncbi:methylated-DNA--[protein]-cysteine S-methyltransferase [Corynebacterium sp. H127]|uniref:methylated-DNA--[protein]-cysteine S-methyltransferase n=1 Tax=Corynebacterium sp. H127 TaxID=3133418 RepID=UPI0030A4B87F